MTHTITVLHVPGCAGGHSALEVARQITTYVADITVEEIVVEDAEQALARGLRGSPTVLVDGREVEPDPGTPVGSMG